MRVKRGASQVMFGLLPQQTADLEGRIWKVSKWVDPIPLPLDQEAVRTALLRASAPWRSKKDQGMDSGLEQELRAGASIDVVGLNMERGVLVDTFPQQWRCKSCGSIARSRTAPCECGARSRVQMQFVAYHTCGAGREPTLPRPCPQHGKIAVRLPGTSTAKELRFFCPVPTCRRTLGKGDGFGFQHCNCGKAMALTVHRAAVVYSPRFAVLVNPSNPAEAAQLRAAGGGARALEWILDGMTGDDLQTQRQTLAGMIQTLMNSKIPEEFARQYAQEMADKGQIDSGDPTAGFAISASTREQAQEEALSLVSAVRGGRIRVSDLAAGASAQLRPLYADRYAEAIREAHLTSVDLLENFPVSTLAFGYTRGDLKPGAARLVPFRDHGHLRAYGSLSKTEALLFQLDPLLVYKHLQQAGHQLPEVSQGRDARLALLERIDIPHPVQEDPQELGTAVLRLVHSYAHRSIRRLAAFAGIERDGLAEYLLPHHLSFVIYAASRSDFVLGGLQAMFETSLHRFLSDVVYGEARCALDPACRSGGGACMACLHLGEPSCRWFNRFLDRAELFGQHGFLTESQ